MRYAGTIVLLMVCLKMYAQTTDSFYSISGNVTETNGAAIPFANVGLFTSDSQIVAGVASDENGKFILKAKPGSYFLKVTFLSFQEKRVGNLVVQNRDLVLDPIIL